MLTKYGISPWCDNSQENVPLQNQQINIAKTQALKTKQNKLLKISQRYLTDNQFIVLCKKNKKKQSKFKLTSKSVSKSTDNFDFLQKPQISSLNIKQKISKKMSTQLFIPSTKIQNNLSSQRNNTLVSTSISDNIKQFQQKKPFLSDHISNNHQNMPYFFTLIQKQNIKFNKQKNSSYQRYRKGDNQEIFKKVDQISIKRKKQIKLPKISVAYSQQFL